MVAVLVERLYGLQDKKIQIVKRGVNVGSPYSYQDAVRKHLARRAEAVGSYCGDLFKRMHLVNAEDVGHKSQVRLQHFVSLMVKCILGNNGGTTPFPDC